MSLATLPVPPLDLARLLNTELSPGPVELAELLDSYSENARLEFLAALGKEDLICLYENFARRLCAPSDFLAAPPEATLVCDGINSLPVLRRFQKRFTAGAPGADPIGHNHYALAALAGPGYFRVKASSDRPGEVVFDYTGTFDKTPPGWPMAQGNDQGLAKFVFGGLTDTVRRVSRDLVVGAAWKQGRPTGDYFALVVTAWRP